MVDHLRGMIPGFATGGVVGSYRDGVTGLTGWLSTENAASVKTVQQATANAIFAALRQGPGFGGMAGPGGGMPAQNARLAQLMMSSWATGAAWQAWNYVAMRESGWNQFARNPSSGAYGIPQALPPTKMPFAAQAAGGSSPVAQIAWMISYIQSAYGSPQNAAAHEAAFNWYDRGGYLPTGLSLALNTTGRPEPVGGGGNLVINNLYVTTPDGPALVATLQAYAKRNGPIKLKIRS